MNKKLLILILVQATLTYSQANWTFFTYIAGDNSLNADAYLDIKEMTLGSNPNVNILAILNTKKSSKKYSQRLIINNKKTQLLPLTLNVDSGAVINLINSLSWAIKNAPSNYLLINMWNHGSGVLNPQRIKRGVCFDDTTGNYLTDIHLKSAMAQAVRLRNGRKIDILSFDACFMASVELETTLSDYVNYIVASEEAIPAAGFNYTSVLKAITSSIIPNDFAKIIVTKYKDLYAKKTEFCLSAVNTSKLKLISANIDKLAKDLRTLLLTNHAHEAKIAITKALNATTYFCEPSYIDLYDFCNIIKQSMSKFIPNDQSRQAVGDIINSSNNIMMLIKQSVINNVASNNLKNSHGLSIYFPEDYIDNSYIKLDWCQKYPNWLKFLQTYLRN